ncbi:MAG: alginate export family protein, partial [Chitinophagaceae bacterium]|nr:alginate export family protein [Chitinophagaceae bacterium]
MKFLLLPVCFYCISCLKAGAQKRPPFQVLRFEESYEFLSDTSVKKTKLDALKSIRVGKDNYLSIGGEINQTFEYVSSPFATQKEDAYWLSRVMLHANLTIKKNIRLFGELANGVINGRNGGARTIDKDELYVLNLFAEWRKKNIVVRIGRQELSYGGENLISVRNGTNVRYTFDGARLIWTKNYLTIDGFVTSYVNTKPGVFDNPVISIKDNIVWGIHISRKKKIALPELSMYYMGYKDPQAFYNQYKGKEYRHSVGIRYNKPNGNFNYTFAAVYQTGKADTLKVNAFQIAIIGTYGIKKTPLKIGVNTYLSSGDKNPDDKTISSFNPYFPQQASFRGAMATRVFPMNVAFLGPRLDINLYPFVI